MDARVKQIKRQWLLDKNEEAEARLLLHIASQSELAEKLLYMGGLCRYRPAEIALDWSRETPKTYDGWLIKNSEGNEFISSLRILGHPCMTLAALSISLHWRETCALATQIDKIACILLRGENKRGELQAIINFIKDWIGEVPENYHKLSDIYTLARSIGKRSDAGKDLVCAFNAFYSDEELFKYSFYYPHRYFLTKIMEI